MPDQIEILRKLRELNQQIGLNDPELSTELADTIKPEILLERASDVDGLDRDIEFESIVLRRGRPVLRILNDTTELAFEDPEEATTWRARITAAKKQIDAAILAIGRINLENGPMSWVGTGWLVRDNVIVTNRHVAEVFVRTGGAKLTFIVGEGGAFAAEVDFLEEFDSTASRAFQLVSPLYVEPWPGPDVAFLEVRDAGGDGLAAPIKLADMPETSSAVAVIGYPAYDSRIPDVDLMEQIYGRAYDRKRLAPGAVTRIDDLRLLHNCTTLGGNSGSAVIDLDSGKALGLHFSGAFMRSNYAVRSDILNETIARALERKPRDRRHSVKPASSDPDLQARAPARAAVVGATTVTIPLRISVSLGQATMDDASAPSRRLADSYVAAGGDDDLIDTTEARPEDYRDREGFKEDFLHGGDVRCPLPQVVERPQDVLSFTFDGSEETELRYQHFSVVMNRPRRLCVFSACNIDGAQARKASRKGWRTDPRIPEEHQIIEECYGSPPMFSRGHMTRRNDPSWGAETIARRGNADSMHVTNAAPQMQAFNAPIWLELEDYALDNAIDDDMRICVFTGPILRDDDPVLFGVKVPVSFWKIIAFIHDHTGELTATGYRMSQQASLPAEGEEFVFGDFMSSHLGVAAQTSIRSIEADRGISFGQLADHDPLSREESVLGVRPARQLLSRGQIRYF